MTDFLSMLGSVLSSGSFLEKALLLVLSGVIVPTVLLILRGTYEQSRKRIEAEKAFRNSQLQAQRAFWEEASSVILTCQTLALDVSWFRTTVALNPEMHKRAFERYNKEIVDLTARWRVLISRASTLASPSIADSLKDLLEQVFIEQDTPIAQLVREDAPAPAWDRQHKRSEAMLAKANATIAEMAAAMGLGPDR